MSQENLISAVIADADKTNIKNCINSTKTSLKDVLQHSLTNDERKSLLKMGDKTLAFVTKVMAYASNNPKLVPAYLDIPEALKDLQLALDLQEIFNELAALTTGVEDALMLAGSEAYDAALIFYGSLKGATHTNVPGSVTILEDLQQRFPRKRTKPGVTDTARPDSSNKT